MKKIYINKTSHALVFGGVMLLPGSNAIEELDGSKFPQLEKLIEEGEIELTDNVEKAVKEANTQKKIEEVASVAPKDEKVKKAAKKRKEQLDQIDKDVKKSKEPKDE